MKLLLASILIVFFNFLIINNSTFASIGSNNLPALGEKIQSTKTQRLQKKALKYLKAKHKEKSRTTKKIKIDIYELLRILTMAGLVILFLFSVSFFVLYPILLNVLSAIVLIILLKYVIKYL